jgi:hypothetical protein
MILIAVFALAVTFGMPKLMENSTYYFISHSYYIRSLFKFFFFFSLSLSLSLSLSFPTPFYFLRYYLYRYIFIDVLTIVF